MTIARTRLAAILAGLLVAVLAACPLIAKAGPRPRAASTPRTQTATAPLAGGGSVTATLSYVPKSSYDSDIDISITRAGAAPFSMPVVSKACPEQCRVGQAPGAHAIHAGDLQGTGEPVVFTDLYSGGAHCCTVTEFYIYDPTAQTYRRTEENWGDPGYRLESLAGHEVFLTEDDAFAYAFTDYAASGEPLKLLGVQQGKLVNVTRDYPSLIRKDAAGWLKAFRAQAKQKFSDSVGVIAAWAADEDELGHSALVARYLTAQAKAKHLNPGISGLPANAHFVRVLDRFLKRGGYLS